MNNVYVLAALALGAVGVIAFAVWSNKKKARLAAARQAERPTPRKTSKMEDLSQKAAQAMLSKYYEVVVSCTNCAQLTGMFLPRGTALKDVTCPKCAVKDCLQAIPLGSLSSIDIDALDIVYPEGLAEQSEAAEKTERPAKVSPGNGGKKSAIFS